MIFAERTVEIVRTALSNDLNLAAGTSTFGCARVGRDRAKLLHGIDRSITGCRCELPGRLVIRIEAIDRDVALIGARTGHRTDSVRRTSSYIVSHDAGLQSDKCGGRTPDLDRKLAKLASVDHIPDRRVGGVERIAGSSGDDIHSRGYVSRGKCGVVCFDLRNTERDVGQCKCLEAGRREG
jgi:hypothetical protein